MTIETLVRIFPNIKALSEFSAILVEQFSREAIRLRGRFLLSLSGGGTPMALYRLLAQSPYREVLAWNKTYFFWGDERCVPLDNPESSYNQAYQVWLSQINVPTENIIRVSGEIGSVSAAEDYARKLETFANEGLTWPRFDLCLLGMGADGHTASLFPGSTLTSGIATVPVMADYQNRPTGRVSLTPDVFNSARAVVFLAAGIEKSGALRATLAEPRDPVHLPAQRIQPVDGKVYWLVDEAAASQLPKAINGVVVQR